MEQEKLIEILDKGWWVVLAAFMMASGRYIFFAGIAYLICYYPGLKRLKRFKIQPSSPKQKQVRNEIRYSISTIFIFGTIGYCVHWLFIHGYTTLYLDISEYGIAYFFLTLVIMIVLHDTYFYWSHRLLHTRWFYKRVHIVHHRSVNPTPWSAYCFHPVEAFIESLFIFPFITLFPVHILAFIGFTFIVLIMNVLGHLGYEFFPGKMRASRFGKWLTWSTHHNLHHQKNKKNFGYYFTFWDRAMDTLYHESSSSASNPDLTDSGIFQNLPVNK